MKPKVSSRSRAAAAANATAQTLDRGLRVLELLSAHPTGMSIADLARALRVDRAVVYRLANTLLARGLAARTARGEYTIGVRVIDLARSAFGSLQTVAAPQLTGLAESTGATATITVADGDEAVLLATVEPPNSALYLAYRPGFRHPLHRSAFGLAILSGRPRIDGERPEIAVARRRGYAVSHGEVMPGGTGIAAPILVKGAVVTSCIGVATVGARFDEDSVAPEVIAASKRIADLLIR